MVGDYVCTSIYCLQASDWAVVFLGTHCVSHWLDFWMLLILRFRSTHNRGLFLLCFETLKTIFPISHILFFNFGLKTVFMGPISLCWPAFSYYRAILKSQPMTTWCSISPELLSVLSHFLAYIIVMDRLKEVLKRKTGLFLYLDNVLIRQWCIIQSNNKENNMSKLSVQEKRIWIL